jgi:hypothetical protein
MSVAICWSIDPVNTGQLERPDGRRRWLKRRRLRHQPTTNASSTGSL